jgi:gliding motility-associated-like protein
VVSTAGLFWVDVTTASGCVTRDSIVVGISALPVVQLNDSTLCDGNTVTLDATNPGSDYVWNTGANDPTILVNTSGTFIVTVTNADGCSTVDSATITFVPYPVVYLGADTALCDGDPLTLDAANPGMSFNWNTSSISQSINPTNTGIYWVDVANGSCVSRDSIGVVFNAIPTDNLSDYTGCAGDIALLDAGNTGSNYAWNTSDTSQSISVTNSGVYTVTVTNPFNCSSTFNATVNFENPPALDLGNDTVLCAGEVLTLSTGLPSADNDWSTGEISESIQVTSTGIYQVTVTTDYCLVEDSINVIFNPVPEPITKEEILTCLDETPGYVMIDAGNPGSDFQWDSGETSQIILAGAYGWYFVSITNQYDCTTADSVVVSQYCPSSLWVPNSFTPNGDGVNDVFMAVGNNIVELEMLIFDRWGNQLFQSDDPSIGWDGTYQGTLVQDDVYVWRIRYRLLDEEDYSVEGPRKEEMGHVTVVR